MDCVELKPGRERSLLRRHPWVYSGAIAKVLGEPVQGETVSVKASTGEFIAWGAYSPNSQIRVRIWSWNPEEVVSPGFFETSCVKRLSEDGFG